MNPFCPLRSLLKTAGLTWAILCGNSLLLSSLSADEAQPAAKSSQAQNDRQNAGLYELRIYTCEPGKLDALNSRFREHTLRLFEKHGMRNVAYWTPLAEGDADPRLIYVLWHASREAATESWQKFRNDPEWQAVAKASAEAHGKILAVPPESVYMSLTDYSPAIKNLDPTKVYELRIYKTHPNKLDALNARFRDHTVGIFARHGLRSYGYWVPTDEPRSANELIYFLEYDSRDSARDGWQKFFADPDWQAARAASEQAGPILSERPLSIYLQPVDYSPVKK